MSIVWTNKKGQNWLKIFFFLVLIPVIPINTFFISSMFRVIICKLFQNKILSSLQTSFYKTVVKYLYFLSEYQICEITHFWVAMRGITGDFSVKGVTIYYLNSIWGLLAKFSQFNSYYGKTFFLPIPINSLK